MNNTEVLTSKATEASLKNDSNLMDIAISEEEEEGVNKCFDECFDD